MTSAQTMARYGMRAGHGIRGEKHLRTPWHRRTPCAAASGESVVYMEAMASAEAMASMYAMASAEAMAPMSAMASAEHGVSGVAGSAAAHVSHGRHRAAHGAPQPALRERARCVRRPCTRRGPAASLPAPGAARPPPIDCALGARGAPGAGARARCSSCVRAREGARCAPDFLSPLL